MGQARPSEIPADSGIRIGRARLHGAVPADRDRLLHRLDSVRPSSLGLPDRAILFVPRLVAGRRLSRQEDGGLFAGHVADALRAALRRARRPGEPGSADDPLLFLDENEAAAALIGHWLEGTPAGDRGWWPLLTGGAPAPLWWRWHLLPDPRRLPAIVALLAGRGLAAAWLRRLEPEEIETAVAAIAQAHALPRGEWGKPPGSASRRPRKPAPAVAEALALVHSVAPEARQPDLPAPARLLLLLALIAERRPALLGTQAARAAFAAAAAETLPPAAPLPAPRRPRHRRPPAVAGSARTLSAPPSGAKSARTPAMILPDFPAAPAPAQRAKAPTPDPAPEEPAPERLPAPAPHRPTPASAARIGPAEEIETEYGGLLFLLNAFLALGVYGDFTRPGSASAGLSPFGLVRLLGRAWFGRRFIADPLHGLLLRLARGRRADTPSQFEARPWSLPSAWLSPWPAAGAPAFGGHRLRPMLWHEAGFPLAEVGPENPAADAARAARRLGLRRAPVRARLPFLPAQPRARWVACLRLYLEARLARALGCEGGIKAAALLCRRPARISADGDRIEARFVLADHPLAIRLAGLDRDPGWVPAAGRDFRYIFE